MKKWNRPNGFNSSLWSPQITQCRETHVMDKFQSHDVPIHWTSPSFDWTSLLSTYFTNKLQRQCILKYGILFSFPFYLSFSRIAIQNICAIRAWKCAPALTWQSRQFSFGTHVRGITRFRERITRSLFEAERLHMVFLIYDVVLLRTNY